MVENRALFNVIGDHCQLPDHLLWMRFTVHHKNYLLQLNINDSFTCFLKKKALFAFYNMYHFLSPASSQCFPRLVTERDI